MFGKDWGGLSASKRNMCKSTSIKSASEISSWDVNLMVQKFKATKNIEENPFPKSFKRQNI